MAAIGSSSTSSRISASSSTSDPAAGDEASPATRALGWLRLTHPFPSVLDGVVSGGVALIGGGAIGQGLRVGLAMTLLQLGIGTVNDLVDSPRDAGRKPGKPIPSGLVRPGPARGLALVLFVSGIALASVAPVVAGLAVLTIAIGLLYDLRLKGTALSWLPFALGIPILPLFGWLSTGRDLPLVFAVLLPAAIVAGAALAIGNALVDVERDAASGTSSVAVALGRDRARRVVAGLLAAIGAAAASSAIAFAASKAEGLLLAAIALIPVVAAVAAGPTSSTARRERAWQAEAIGLAALASAWLVVVVRAGGLA